MDDSEGRFVTRSCAVAGTVAALLLGACATPEAQPAPSASNARFGVLTPRKLATGECGLFLWARSPSRRLVFYGAMGGGASAVLNGREVALTRIDAHGAEVLGQFEEQAFSYGDYRIDLQVKFSSRPGMERGAVAQGTLRLAQADGWEYVMPVGGLNACDGS